MKLKYFLFSFYLFLTACSGISPLSKKKFDDLYSKEFLAKIAKIKETYRSGKAQEALLKLKNMSDDDLIDVEKALKKNLIGVIHFATENYEQAIFHFDLALTTSKEDLSLTAQIYLNLASSYYKLQYTEKSYSELLKADFRYLSEAESNKRHKLAIKLSQELSRDDTMIEALFHYLGRHKELSALKSDSYFEVLNRKFFEKSDREKVRLLEKYNEYKFLITGYLGYLEGEKVYYRGDKDDAKGLVAWIGENYGQFDQLKRLVENFSFRMDNYAKLNPNVIGIVLPLTGKNSKFGKRALYGIDTALNEYRKNNPNVKVRVVVEDSKGSGAVGAYKARKLIETYNVAAIVGGLFSNEAEEVYQESKMHGVFFVSLSQIYLPKEEKDHLLLEIPGSVESHLNQLFSDEILSHFGKRAAIVYPDSERGKAYLNEFWRKANSHEVDVKGALSYKKDSTDYRPPVSNLLGLKNTRSRKEEQELIKEIHSLEKYSPVRRVNHLEPIVDFDWVFIPSYPREARQLMPSFTYYDAFNLNFFGDSSWRSKSLSRDSSRLGNLYFIGDDVEPNLSKFVGQFLSLHRKKPKLIELRAYDATSIVTNILATTTFASRDELDIYIRGKEKLGGLTGNWKLEDGVWLKLMVPLRLRSNRIEPIKMQAKAVEI